MYQNTTDMVDVSKNAEQDESRAANDYCRPRVAEDNTEKMRDSDDVAAEEKLLKPPDTQWCMSSKRSNRILHVLKQVIQNRFNFSDLKGQPFVLYWNAFDYNPTVTVWSEFTVLVTCYTVEDENMSSWKDPKYYQDFIFNLCINFQAVVFLFLSYVKNFEAADQLLVWIYSKQYCYYAHGSNILHFSGMCWYNEI